MDILAVLQQKTKINVPSMQYGEKLNNVIISISQLLGKADEKSILQSPSPLMRQDPPRVLASPV